MKIKKIKLKSTEQYVAANYPHSGMFEVNGFVIYVNQDTLIACQIDNITAFKEIAFEKVTTAKQESENNPKTLEKVSTELSEDFFFKTLALVVNKEKVKDIIK